MGQVGRRASFLSTQALGILIGFVGCGQAPQSTPETAVVEQFFENAERRDANEHERNVVAKVDSGCAAFFVRNTAGKIYLGSARHCFNYNITTWCQNGTLRDNDGQQGRCKRVVAADATHDIAIFEAEMASVPDEMRTLRLAAYEPDVQARLVMIGYPVDRYRNGALTVTENCWILSSRVSSPYRDSRLGDRSSLHNCSTYGGNSGGPMIREGSDDVVGLPFTYAPGDYHDRDADDLSTAAHMAQMADFVAAQRETLESAGVVIADAP